MDLGLISVFKNIRNIMEVLENFMIYFIYTMTHSNDFS